MEKEAVLDRYFEDIEVEMFSLKWKDGIELKINIYFGRQTDRGIYLSEVKERGSARYDFIHHNGF